MRYPAFVVLGVLTLTGCSPGEGADLAPAFPEGSGQQPQGALEYPAGPYGVNKGATIRNFEFPGFINSLENNQELELIQLADFYNPTGDGVHEEGSGFEPGSPKPLGLLLSVSAVWCGPCNYEADEVLPKQYPEYKARRGEFLVQLADGATARQGRHRAVAHRVDEEVRGRLPHGDRTPRTRSAALFEADAFPANMLIDTRTMKIVESVAGAPQVDGPFWKAFDKLLDVEE